MEQIFAKVLILTGIPGTSQEQVALALDSLGMMVADTASFISHTIPDASLEIALENEDFFEFDQVLNELLCDLFDDILNQQNRHTASFTKLQFVISVPAISFLSRICPKSAGFLRRQLAAANVYLAVLDSDLSQLIVQNHLFGANNNIVMPRRILRTQIREFKTIVSSLDPIWIDVSQDQTAMDSAKLILQHLNL